MKPFEASRVLIIIYNPRPVPLEEKFRVGGNHDHLCPIDLIMTGNWFKKPIQNNLIHYIFFKKKDEDSQFL
jgi:hypothetical protein